MVVTVTAHHPSVAQRVLRDGHALTAAELRALRSTAEASRAAEPRAPPNRRSNWSTVQKAVRAADAFKRVTDSDPVGQPRSQRNFEASLRAWPGAVDVGDDAFKVGEKCYHRVHHHGQVTALEPGGVVVVQFYTVEDGAFVAPRGAVQRFDPVQQRHLDRAGQSSRRKSASAAAGGGAGGPTKPTCERRLYPATARTDGDFHAALRPYSAERDMRNLRPRTGRGTIWRQANPKAEVLTPDKANKTFHGGLRSHSATPAMVNERPWQS